MDIYDNGTYTAIEAYGAADSAARVHNVGTMGNGEPYPVQDMPDADWQAFQAWVMDMTAADVRRGITEKNLEIAGAFDPRCQL